MIWDTYDSPLGKMVLCCDGNALTAVVFEDQKYGDLHIPLNAIQQAHPIFEQTIRWLSRYFRGEIPDSLPPIVLKGTPFQQQVWQALLQIPYGTTVTYGQLAKQLGCKSAQAVGGAVGRNPISILIPCHRVVGADGSLTGYAGGVGRKQFLLTLEKASP